MNSRTKNIIYIALSVALNCICSWITVPFTIPFTLQTFSIFFTLFFLGGLKGTISITIYLLLGLVGVPVFSNFNCGISAFIGPTGGYLIGFLVLGIIYTIITLIFKNNSTSKLIATIIGLIICYIIGTIWYVFVYTSNSMESYKAVILACIIPYIIPDILKIVLAYYVANKTNILIKRKHENSMEENDT